MNPLPYVSWGMYGGATAAARRCFLVSWGLRESLQNVVFVVVGPDMILLTNGRLAKKIDNELYLML
jgi:hypothetical protein